MPSMTLTCRICSLPMQRGKTSSPQGVAAHNHCRSGLPRSQRQYKGGHGQGGYSHGCRCEICRAAKAEAMRRYNANYKREHGESWNARWRREFKEQHGYWPQRGGGDWISPTRRSEIYERDGLACYLCGDVLDRSTPSNEPKALTIDHVIPRSKGGTDESDNLKTCCRECNIRKADMMPNEEVLI